jgi:DNA-binding protein YbaB
MRAFKSTPGGKGVVEHLDADAAELRAYAEELRAKFMRMQEETPALHEQARAVRVTEKSPDGLVTVTVGARGDLIKLELDPRIYRRPDSRRLADVITQTVRKAADKAQDRIVELFAPLVPPDQMRATLEGDLDAVLRQMGEQLRGRR